MARWEIIFVFASGSVKNCGVHRPNIIYYFIQTTVQYSILSTQSVIRVQGTRSEVFSV